MKRYALAIASFSLLVFGSCHTHVPKHKEGMTLVWHDEFNGSGPIDQSKWQFATGGGGFGNHELQYYTNRRKNARIEKGHLIIEAHKEDWKENHYTSAKLQTKDLQAWTYGRFEIRAKLPKGKGTWPAIWMMSQNMQKWPDDGEIDIMEHVGYNPGVVHATVHTKKYNHKINTQISDTVVAASVSDAFHVYTLDWSKDRVEVSIDGKKFYTYENAEKSYDAWPLDQPFYMILNQAVGGDWGGKMGVDSTVYPQKFYVDYVRVYQ